MRTKLPLGVVRERSRHGKVVYYYRDAKGPRTRLPDIADPNFREAYKAVLIGEVYKPAIAETIQSGTLSWLVQEYSLSLHFRSLDAVTQRRRQSFFSQMTEKSGNVNITRITEKAIIDAREKRAYGKGHAANNFLKAVKPMFAYAKSRGWLNQDPAKDITYVRPLKGSRPAWTFEDVIAYEHRHPVGTMANLAMRILLFTGLRRSDAIELGPMHLEDGIITFMPSKTKTSSGVKVSFRALPPLLEALEHTEIGTEAFIITERKTPFASGASFGTWFKNRCDEAGVEFRAHGLRKTGPALAAEAGASANELMAMWGWSTLAQAELYTKSANRKILGDSAATKLMNGYSEMLKNSGNTPRT